MSDAARQNLKVSREGIVLIKSFEGFRPRAIQRADGGWVIGYGHTLSAREGASVSEADAELLLRYDLLPVEISVNDVVPAPLNQHQFDALVSFAFSVGLDRFASSDVRRRLAAGSPDDAADAMMGWPAPTLPEPALRRRAAERALFVANPAMPVALSDLLVAPLPVLPLPTPVEEPVIQQAAEPEPPVEAVASVDPRGAAVAALLGEPPARLVADETEAPAPSNDNPPVEEAVLAAEPMTEAQTLETTALAPADAEGPSGSSTATTDAAAWPVRYAPYSLSMVGPLPHLEPATTHAGPDNLALDHPLLEALPAAASTASEARVEPVEVEITEPAAVADGDAPPPVEPGTGVPELVLTPLEESHEPALTRPLWTAQERSEADGSASNLFGEDVGLTLGGSSIMRHEIQVAAPTRFDWKGAAPLVFMGGVGLVSFGASMAAFRRAAEQAGSSELTLIGLILALIGLGCVGVSALNLYRKFGVPRRD